MLALMLQANTAAPGQPAPGLGGMLPMMLIMMAIIYFMMIRPQQKRAKQHQEWLKGLNKGDEVITQGGIVGRIASINELFITLEVADKVRIRVLRSSVTGKPPEPKPATGTAASLPPATASAGATGSSSGTIEEKK